MKSLLPLFAILLPMTTYAQVNSGSDGHDGALNPTSNLVIDMVDHPDGIYQYTSVNIPAGVTVSFIPNENNRPVVWLVQQDCVINGTIDVSGKSAYDTTGGAAGPGGWPGGSGGSNPTAGRGPGGGAAAPGDQDSTRFAQGGAFGTVGSSGMGLQTGSVYGNPFLIPLLGGSGGGGANFGGGGGGGGSILIASSKSIQIDGRILAVGGAATSGNGGVLTNLTTYGGGGSGGSVRLVAVSCTGNGVINAGIPATAGALGPGGLGRVRIDDFRNALATNILGISTQGFQPIIIPASDQGVQLAIASVGGISPPANPGGVLINPDVIIPGQQANPISIVVHCANIPLNTEVSVVVHPASGPDVLKVGLNNVGTFASSTATVSLNMPRGGGIIYAKAVTGIAAIASTANGADAKTPSLAETGWTADGEGLVAMEITASLGGKQSITYLTKSGKRYSFN